jgi:hypothetical protein
MICSGAAGLPANAAPGVPTATSAYWAWPLWNRIATRPGGGRAYLNARPFAGLIGRANEFVLDNEDPSPLQ